MARLRQGIRVKSAKPKNTQSKYKFITTKYIFRNITPTAVVKKYAYTRKIKLANGKYRYYYS